MRRFSSKGSLRDVIYNVRYRPCVVLTASLACLVESSTGSRTKEIWCSV